jgi:hypothetical protein
MSASTARSTASVHGGKGDGRVSAEVLSRRVSSYCSILTAHPDVKFVRAHWEVARWGRGVETPMFEVSVSLKEIPAEIFREAARLR